MKPISNPEHRDNTIAPGTELFPDRRHVDVDVALVDPPAPEPPAPHEAMNEVRTEAARKNKI